MATALGAAVGLTPVGPVQALYWTAAVNSVVAVPVLAAMMRLAGRAPVTGEAATAGPALRPVGWAATAAMTLAVAAMALVR